MTRAKKAHLKIIPIDLYKRGVLVFVGNEEQFVNYAKQKDLPLKEEEIKESLSGALGVTFNLPTDAVMYLHPEVSDGVIVHEILHAAKHILRLVEIESEEAEAYLVEYLYDQIVPWFREITSLDVQSG